MDDETHFYVSGYVFHKAEAINYFIPVASCTFLVTFIMMLLTCAW